MKSLRVLAALLLSLLRLFGWNRPTRAERRAAHGPAHPYSYVYVRQALPAPAPRMHHAPRRPAPVRPPEHILAILAAAPAVEPEFAARRRVRLEPLRALAVRLRVFNPKPAPEAPARAAQPTVGPSYLSRAVSAVHEWLVFDSPPPARHHSVRA